MSYNEEQTDYIIELGKQLERQRQERFALEVKKVRQLLDKATEVNDQYKKLNQLQKEMKDYKRPSIVVLPNGRMAWSDQLSYLVQKAKEKEA